MKGKNLLFPTLLAYLYCLGSAQQKSDADYVIVGAGTAGCALAARLCTLLPSAKITLIERGIPRNKSADFLVRSPRQMWNAWRSTQVSELFPTVPNPGIFNRTIDLITGNTLGGSSAINGMQWVVPTAGTVEKWGIQGLTTDTSKKFYRRAFRTVGFAAQCENLRHKYVREFINASAAAGFPESFDPLDNSVTRDMFENRLAIDAKGFRTDSCTAYLTPVLNGACKQNLLLLQSQTVTKIILEGSKVPRAVGVECTSSRAKNSSRRTIIRARREVLVTAGPFASPKLLQLSGIGPPDVLRKAGIRSRVSLEVGSRTQARPFGAILSTYAGVPLEPSNNSTLLNSLASREQWESGRGGVLGIGSFLTNGRDRRNAYLTGTGSFAPEFVDKPFVAVTCNLNSKSIGYIRVKNSDPFAFPEVQTSLLTKKVDVHRMQRCLNGNIKIHENYPKNFQLSFVNPPGGRVSHTWIRNATDWTGHFVGGCSVGPVLRSDLSVRKMKGLRVIDASSLRTLPTSAGPMSSVYMIAELLSEQIAGSFRSSML